jgi:hypothetical protein
MTTYKNCAKCGTEFKRSPADRTVNCPACRVPAKVEPAGRKKDAPAPRGATCTVGGYHGVGGCGRPAVVTVPGTDNCYECAEHSPRGSF